MFISTKIFLRALLRDETDGVSCVKRHTHSLAPLAKARACVRFRSVPTKRGACSLHHQEEGRKKNRRGEALLNESGQARAGEHDDEGTWTLRHACVHADKKKASGRPRPLILPRGLFLRGWFFS